MGQNSRFTAIFLGILFLLQALEPFLAAQSAPLTPQELDQLLSPIALYPDSLLSQIMTASTNPQEILDVDNWLSQNPGLSGTALTDAAEQQGFDPAFLALVNFPQVLEMMAQHIDDYAAIGQAFSTDQVPFSDCAHRRTPPDLCAATRNRPSRSSRHRDGRFTSYSRRIRRSSTCRNTIPRWSMLARRAGWSRRR